MDYLYYLVAFFVIVNVIVFVHELGHYLAARKVGVQVTTFSLGMGPEIFGFNDKNGTRWCFSLLPIGGYVMMLGDADASSTTEDIESLKELSEEEKQKSIICKSNWEKILISFGGPFFNYLYAFVVLVIMGMSCGIPRYMPVIGEVMKDTPAETAGLAVGDKIISVNGQKVEKFRDVLVSIANSDKPEVIFEIDRNGQPVIIGVTPKVMEKKSGRRRTRKTKIVGIKPGEAVLERASIFQSLKNAAKECISSTQEMFVMFSRLFSGKKSLDDFGGVVHMASVAGDMAKAGNFAILIFFTVTLSLNLGFINLLPIPVLDGGRIFICFIEQITRRKLNEKLQLYVMIACALLLILLMSATTINDILKIEAVDKFVSRVLE
ncbi:MAG: RIP metalloprotease RseP [Holosporaceae bacterium]|jgi:regulator of sigma E protease|nr:RIP metalloprotease RseP [Holosporaceae bacterium]